MTDWLRFRKKVNKKYARKFFKGGIFEVIVCSNYKKLVEDFQR